MRTYRSSGLGCFFLLLLVLLVVVFILRLFGALALGIISNPVLFLLILVVLFLSRSNFGKRQEEEKKDSTMEYEFIDDEDPDS